MAWGNEKTIHNGELDLPGVGLCWCKRCRRSRAAKKRRDDAKVKKEKKKFWAKLFCQIIGSHEEFICWEGGLHVFCPSCNHHSEGLR